MKKIVLFDEFNEIDLKPSNLLHEYIRLTEKDVNDLLVKRDDLKSCPCPGCRSLEAKPAFSKFKMSFLECALCKTLYVSPRPGDEAVNAYYQQSNARKYWRDKLSKLTGNKRKEKVVKPRFDWILDSVSEYDPNATHIVDIHTDQFGYIDELAKNRRFQRKTLFYPLMPLDNVKGDGDIRIVRNLSEEKALYKDVDIVTIFEVADHTADVEKLFDIIVKLLKPGGLCFMTAILISGYDLQILWERAENIFPPDRLNVFSVEGLKSLFERRHYECLEFSTPGILDTEIVIKTMEQNPDIPVPRFIDYILKNRGIETHRSLQEFLQNNLLSSYGRFLLKKG